MSRQNATSAAGSHSLLTPAAPRADHSAGAIRPESSEPYMCLLCNRGKCRCDQPPPNGAFDWTPWWTGLAANA